MDVGSMIYRKVNNLFVLADKFPTTRFRIMVSVCLIAAMVVTWLKHACEVRNTIGECLGWEPSTNMLIFLSALVGIDLAQYLVRSRAPYTPPTEPMKKPTDTTVDDSIVEPAPEGQEEPTASTDVSEVNLPKG